MKMISVVDKLRMKHRSFWTAKMGQVVEGEEGYDVKG